MGSPPPGVAGAHVWPGLPEVEVFRQERTLLTEHGRFHGLVPNKNPTLAGKEAVRMGSTRRHSKYRALQFPRVSHAQRQC